MSKNISYKRKVFDSLNSALIKSTGLKLDQVSGRNIPIKENDQLIVSYPKSGNTWVCFLVSNLLHPNESINFTNVLQFIPDIYGSSKILFQQKGPRILKSHEYFDPRYKKVVYIVRDPRSVAVSYYHYLIRRKVIKKEDKFSDYLKSFFEGDYNTYGAWHENVGSWLGAAQGNNNRLLLIKYEDLLIDPDEKLKSIAEFLQIEYTPDDIAQAIRNSSFDQMREKEKREEKHHKNLKHEDHSIPFVRKADTEEWKNFFNKKDQDLLLNYCQEQMQLLGYHS